MQKHIQGKKQGGRGVRRFGLATIELALMMSILVSITYGSIEYGYYFFVKNTMQGAAREGCRAGIVGGATAATINQAILNQLQAANLVPSSTSAPSTLPCTIGSYSVSATDLTTGTAVTVPANMTVGDSLEVSITATWSQVGSAVNSFGLIGSSKQLSAASTMRKEGD